MGGGRRNLVSNGMPDPDGEDGEGRKDGKNLIDEWIKDKEKKGKAKYVWDREDLLALDPSKLDYLMGNIRCVKVFFFMSVPQY